MRLIIALTIALCMFQYVSAQSCTELTCQKFALSSCTGDIYNRLVAKVEAKGVQINLICPSQYYCGDNPFWNASNTESSERICLPLGNVGHHCDPTIPVTCVPGLQCYPPFTPAPPVRDIEAKVEVDATTVYTCQILNFLTVGEKCSVTSDCYSPDSRTQIECDGFTRTCTPMIPSSKDSTCISDDHCPPNQFCNQTTNCLPRVALGGNCSENADSCVVNAICASVSIDNNNMTCIPIFSRQENETCSFGSSYHGFLDACDISKNVYCQAGICRAAPAPVSTTNCSKDACSSNQRCMCTPANPSGECITSYIPADTSACKTTALAYFDCLAASNCADGNANVPKSCGYQKCKKPLCDYMGACNTPNPFTSCFSGNDNFATIGFCGNLTPGASSITSPAIIITVLSVILALMF
ncbi:hypothetical protein SAMD00019534_013950 [Acytostelium subglobosum LB1]|uniref:hypothetical protein n=1 Tax=Acytostelium subglobosum LB1 TaxID=1410327 RepID=UPI0006447DE8|nr:hypothetical protein SAMD00019534_013950 [Acytostelium subglobosum LB1]GAM18220.1 hypothetical protein SAMD00019534_013950 [Acytostelium subglobosum LB1]|eukprot:XP_012758816.1 hypothetical protein SAMD00019534_013950 [Acytostelium subglobosum LB1]